MTETGGPQEHLATRTPGGEVRLAGGGVRAAILVSCFLSVAMLLAEFPSLFRLDEAGYGDSYVLYDVQQYLRSGVIYRDLSQPPYTPSSYGPLVYVLFSLPDRMVSFENPFLGVRLISVAAFFLCVATAVSITRQLVPERRGWLWGLLLALSIGCMYPWILQIRGDFPAIFCGLLAIRLLLTRSPRGIVLAGLCGGAATQFKFTMVAALAAGFLWLLARRSWLDLARFTGAGVFASAGAYALWSLREPRMIAQVTSMRLGVVDVSGCLQLLLWVFSEPVVLLSVVTIPLFLARVTPQWALLLLFAAISFGIATLTDLHPGGNINYFYESLFAIVPVATLGVFRMVVAARRSAAVEVLAVALMLLLYAFPAARNLYGHAFIWRDIGFGALDADNASFRRLQEALQGRRIFSTVERLALLDPAPALINAFQSWAVNLPPVLARVRSAEFDVVITTSTARTWRGINHIVPDLRREIAAAYAPHCVVRGSLLHLPRNRPPDSALVQALSLAGCEPVAGQPGSAGPGW